MKLLIDSSTYDLFLGLYEDGVVDMMVKNAKNNHSETLVDALHLFLEKNNITVEAIDEILVGRGPGSYTGVRISGTVAKVLALVKHKPLYSFSTLDLLLASKMKENGLFLARIVAKKNHSYYKGASIQQGEITFTTPDTFGPDEQLQLFGDYTMIDGSADAFEHRKEMVKAIVEKKLYQVEDVFTYVPNYLRNEING
ncbi:MAG: tRNA (adenosine(37)-N6)-threonylcarbamoyltransferase complex dimerization subunit type 1 TsaB [Prevotella sp.]|nr:tRNA (adenosine(37)-N6)-threonylcarbamoyltransferase complex dimerization subunit type 1 TsaB [Staphylococcus sp.]MCM1350558.1 tRNA (adenosine(37)-N6)-threonylcarbamoyltransferase complex dimerization subunit type 1 TsaB [Prevotella sp.]